MVLFGSNGNKEQASALAAEDEGKVSHRSPQRRWTLSCGGHPQRRRTQSDETASAKRQNDAHSNATAVRNSFLAGLTAGITGTLVGHPLDSVKVWAQTGHNPTAGSRGSGSRFAISNLLQSLRQSYAGVAGPLLTVGLIQSINFTAYDSMRRYWYYNYERPHANPADKTYLHQDSFTSVAISGVAAGAVVSVITQPVMMIKTVQQTRPSFTFGRAIRHCLRHPLVGFGTHFFVETANRSIYFVTYEGLKRKYTPDEGGQATMSTRMLSAMVAGMACWVFIYPTDVIRTQLYAASVRDEGQRPVRLGPLLRRMYAQQGFRSFFNGFTITTLRAGPVAAFILPVYDVVLDQLNKLSL